MSVILRSKRLNEEYEDETCFRANPPRVLTFDECAKFLRVSAPTLRALVREEGLPCRRVGKATRLFSTDAVVRWVEGTEGQNAARTIGFLSEEGEEQC